MARPSTTEHFSSSYKLLVFFREPNRFFRSRHKEERQQKQGDHSDNKVISGESDLANHSKHQ
jgi:hypothetical protein